MEYDDVVNVRHLIVLDTTYEQDIQDRNAFEFKLSEENGTLFFQLRKGERKKDPPSVAF